MIRAFLLRLLLAAFLLPFGALAQPLERPAAMAPLEVRNWDEFRDHLGKAKAAGITAISTDVWWGKVEGNADQQFEWSYYDQVSQAIADAGLKWVPILSFHQCGGNVGDDCDIPLPRWLWRQLGGDSPDRLKYKSEKGNISSEVIALWADTEARGQYAEFVAAFRERYRARAAQIAEINVSAGPSGELRYPSYNAHDGFSYPQRGYLQAYSEAAVADFIAYARGKYATLERLNAAWNTQLRDWNQVRPPSNPDEFFGLKDYLNIQYGKDFTHWYNQALVKHGEFMLNLVKDTLGDDFPGVPLGIKIPGVHWQMSSPSIPRSAEVSAGLIPTDIDIFGDYFGHGYAPIVAMVKRNGSAQRPVVLHFTCLEMDNGSAAPNYSLAQDLVFWVAQAANAQGIGVMGENALSGGVAGDHGWDNIDNAIRWSSYRGLTTLRLADLAANNGLGFQRYRRLIEEFRAR